MPGPGRRWFVWGVIAATLTAGLPAGTPLRAEEPAAARPVWQVLRGPSDDSRLKPPRLLQDEYHPWQPPETRSEWEQARARIQQRILVSNGLFPLWPKTPLEPVIHGRIDRGDYTVERVFFASLPGHYVTGSLYRPKNATGRLPGVLCPHGHWPDGRFHDAGPESAARQLEQGAETFLSGARHPLQARMVQLARMGCVVFHYDMVGNADSTVLDHREGFGDAQAGLRLQNWMGLQTWNSIRALDFLTSLPDVDPERIGVTGASGGGTQTFILCAIDPRPAVAFPAVMVSTAMQGGCVCENADYLRVGVNNIAFTACFAPRPQALSGANDWTIHIETRGLPELKQVYALYGAADRVHAQTWPEFTHNYNQHARELMYDWFSRHLGLGLPSPVRQQDFWPLTRAEMTVFTDEHPLPADAADITTLRARLTKIADRQLEELIPRDPASLERYRETVGAAARVLFDGGPPGSVRLIEGESTQTGHDAAVLTGLLSPVGTREKVPYAVVVPEEFNGTLVFWFDSRGKQHLFDENGSPLPAVRDLVQRGMAVASADLFLTGENVPADSDSGVWPPVNEKYSGYTFGYNRPVVVNRVRDVLTAVTAALSREEVRRVHLVGTAEAGPWVMLARGLLGGRVHTTLADTCGFDFTKIDRTDDPMYLPGALRYGGLGGLTALGAPARLVLSGYEQLPERDRQILDAAYQAAGGEVGRLAAPLTAEVVAEQILSIP